LTRTAPHYQSSTRSTNRSASCVRRGSWTRTASPSRRRRRGSRRWFSSVAHRCTPGYIARVNGAGQADEGQWGTSWTLDCGLWWRAGSLIGAGCIGGLHLDDESLEIPGKGRESRRRRIVRVQWEDRTVTDTLQASNNHHSRIVIKRRRRRGQ
jgi:hypothetical protein